MMPIIIDYHTTHALLTTTTSTATSSSNILLNLGNEFNEPNQSLLILRNLLTAIGSIVVGLGIVTFLTINFVVPAAADQLESDTKRLKPELWDEYQDKLEEGETMRDRPDLMQELGNIMKPFVMDSYDPAAAQKNKKKEEEEEE